MKKHIRDYLAILIRHLLGTFLSGLIITVYGLLKEESLPDIISGLYFMFWFFIITGLPFILTNSFLILLTFSTTKKFNFIISLCVRFLIVAVIGWVGAYLSATFLALLFYTNALSVTYPPLAAGAFVGAFGNVFQLKNKKFILNLCMSTFIILFFSGASILHSFIRENILVIGHNTVIGLKKIEKQFNNDEALKKHYCPNSGNKIRNEYTNSLCYPDNLQMFIDLYHSKGIVLEPFMELKNPWQIRREAVVFFVFPYTSHYLPFGRMWHYLNIPKRGSVIYFHNGKRDSDSYGPDNSGESTWSFFPKTTEFSKKQIVIRKEDYNLCVSMDASQRVSSCFVNYFKSPFKQ